MQCKPWYCNSRGPYELDPTTRARLQHPRNQAAPEDRLDQEGQLHLSHLEDRADLGRPLGRAFCREPREDLLANAIGNNVRMRFIVRPAESIRVPV